MRDKPGVSLDAYRARKRKDRGRGPQDLQGRRSLIDRWAAYRGEAEMRTLVSKGTEDRSLQLHRFHGNYKGRTVKPLVLRKMMNDMFTQHGSWPRSPSSVVSIAPVLS